MEQQMNELSAKRLEHEKDSSSMCEDCWSATIKLLFVLKKRLSGGQLLLILRLSMGSAIGL